MKLVLLPGMHGSGELFDRLERALPGEHEVVRVSYPAEPCTSYSDLSPSLERAITPGEPYVLIAESFSGPLALAHAAERPAGLAGLVLCATFASNPLPDLVRLSWLVSGALFRLPMPCFALKHWLPGSMAEAELVDALSASIRAVPPHVMASRVRLVLATDMAECAGRIEAPTLILTPARDRLLGRRGLETLTACLPKAKSVVLSGPHLLLQARPAECGRVIDYFLSDLCRQRA